MNRDCDNACAPGSCLDYPCEELVNPESPFYVYVAGRLSGTPGEYLANVAEMSDCCRQLMEYGFCPINPAGDLLEGLMSSEPLPVLAYQLRSLQLLRLLAGVPRKALLVVTRRHRDGRASSGVAGEVDLAGELGIPLVETLPELLALRRDGP